MHTGICTLFAALVLLVAQRAAAQEVDLLIYSSTNGGGALVLEGAIGDIVRVTPRLPFCPGGICPYSSTNPGFVTPAADLPGAGVFALDAGTRISLVVTAIDPAASLKIGSTVLDAVGESAALGEATGLHTHPEWQMQAPQGHVGEYPVSFKLTTSAPGYDESAVYTTVLTNGAVSPASPTPSPTSSPAPPATATDAPTASATATAPGATETAAPTATASVAPTATRPIDASPTAPAATPEPTATDTAGTAPSPSPTLAVPACAGDCNGDGRVAINELITGVSMALGAISATCAAVDGNRDGRVSINELIIAVNGALGAC